jgi:hypothetical protein
LLYSPGLRGFSTREHPAGLPAPTLPERPSAVFRCFSVKLSAASNVFSAEILTFGRYGARKKAAMFAVSRCFSLLSCVRICIKAISYNQT